MRLTVHHSLTKDGITVDWQAIRRFHTSWRYNGRIVTEQEGRSLPGAIRPWKKIGYHCGAEMINDHYEILIGRMFDEPGAHTKGHNIDNIGFLFVGNFDLGPVPKAQWDLGVEFVKMLVRLLHIHIGDIKGHREIARDGRTCPGRMFDLHQFRQEVAA
jgi:sugar phosphate isomerase/epimerase